MLYNDGDEIFRWFTPPGEENHIPEWWNWLSTFQKETPQPPIDRAANIEALRAQCKRGGYIYATIPTVADPTGSRTSGVKEGIKTVSSQQHLWCSLTSIRSTLTRRRSL